MKIYVACLASYNNGVLHGRWIDASSDVDEMRDEVNAMLRESKFPNVEVECPLCGGTGETTFHNSETGDTRQDTCPTCRGEGRVPSAEEYAIHDFDGLPSTLGEYCGLDTIAEIVEFVEGPDLDEDDAVALLDDCGCDVGQAQERAQEFCGKWDSFRDYADDHADECLLGDSNVPDIVARYFDYEAFARDLAMDMHTIDVPDGVLVFYA